jgi:hypothetical protein
MSTQMIDFKKIALGGAKGIVVSVMVNVVLFLIFSATGIIPTDFPVPQADNQPLTVVPVIISSIMPLVIATLVFMALVKFTKQPVKIFGIVALVIVILSLWGPFGIPNVPIGMAIGLNIMHLVAAYAIYWGLSKSV